jgi:hypothetical protein
MSSLPGPPSTPVGAAVRIDLVVSPEPADRVGSVRPVKPLVVVEGAADIAQVVGLRALPVRRRCPRVHVHTSFSTTAPVVEMRNIGPAAAMV